MKYKNSIIHIDAFYSDIIMHFGSEQSLKKQLYKYMCKKDADELLNKIDFNCEAMTVFNQEKKIFFVWMPRVPENSQDFGFLVHELFHAVVKMLDTIGVTPTESSEEVYAYTLGYLMQRVIETFNLTLGNQALKI